MSQFLQIEDALLANDTALPNGASTTVTSAVIDLDAIVATGKSLRQANVEVGVSIPGLTTTMLPDTRTLTLDIETSDDPAFGSGVEVIRTLVITGAGGVGNANPTLLQTRIEPNGTRYVRAKAVSGASTTDMSTLKMHMALKF